MYFSIFALGFAYDIFGVASWKGGNLSKKVFLLTIFGVFGTNVLLPLSKLAHRNVIIKSQMKQSFKVFIKCNVGATKITSFKEEGILIDRYTVLKVKTFNLM